LIFTLAAAASKEPASRRKIAPTSPDDIHGGIMLRLMSRRLAGSAGEALIIQGNFAQQAQHISVV
jgi:hypothetical protein